MKIYANEGRFIKKKSRPRLKKLKSETKSEVPKVESMKVVDNANGKINDTNGLGEDFWTKHIAQYFPHKDDFNN